MSRLGRGGDKTTILNQCVECEREIISAFRNDYLCIWCRYELETGVKVAPPNDVKGGEFSAMPGTSCERMGCHINPNTMACTRCDRVGGVVITSEGVTPIERTEWKPSDFGPDLDWTDFDL